MFANETKNELVVKKFFCHKTTKYVYKGLKMSFKLSCSKREMLGKTSMLKIKF